MRTGDKGAGAGAGETGKGNRNRSRKNDNTEDDDDDASMIYSQQYTESSSQDTEDSVWTDDTLSDSPVVTGTPRRNVRGRKRFISPSTPKAKRELIMTPPDSPAETISANGRGVARRKVSCSIASKTMPISTKTTSNIRFGPPSPIPFGDTSPISQKPKARNFSATAPLAPSGRVRNPSSSSSTTSRLPPTPPHPPPPPLALPHPSSANSSMESTLSSFEDFTWEKTASYWHKDQGGSVQHQKAQSGVGSSAKSGNGKIPSEGRPAEQRGRQQQRSQQQSIVTSSGGSFLRFTLEFGFDILRTVFNLLRKPLAYLIVFYIFVVMISMAGKYTTDIIYAVLSPLCSIPGVSRFEILPFCKYVSSPYDDDYSDDTTTAGSGSSPIPLKKIFWTGKFSMPNYPQLIDLQSNFDEILENSQMGSGMVLAMRSAQISVRDLSTLVKVSKLGCKEELGNQLDQFVSQGKEAARGLSKFGARVGGVVDMIVAMDGFALRALEEIKQKAEEDRQNPLYNSFVLAPFRFKAHLEMEKQIIDTFNRASVVTDLEIQKLILEAEHLLRELQEMDISLLTIQKLIIEEDTTLQAKSEEILSELWTYLGGNKRKLANLQYHHDFLSSLQLYRAEALRHVSRTLVQLQDMSSNMEQLRDQVVKTRYVNDEQKILPLEVHIETIRKGVERLSDGRKKGKEKDGRLWEGAIDRMYSGDTVEVGGKGSANWKRS